MCILVFTAATALYTGLTGKYNLAGIIALSGYMPIRNSVQWSTVHKTPVFQAHGTADNIVLHLIGMSMYIMFVQYSRSEA